MGGWLYTTGTRFGTRFAQGLEQGLAQGLIQCLAGVSASSCGWVALYDWNKVWLTVCTRLGTRFGTRFDARFGRFARSGGLSLWTLLYTAGTGFERLNIFESSRV